MAIDLGLGQPMEHMLRSCLIALRLAEAAGMDAATRAVVYYADLVAWIGCHADSYMLAATFGDDIEFRGDYYLRDRSEPGWGRALTGRIGHGKPLLERWRQQSTFVLSGGAPMAAMITSHCLSAGLFAERLGLGADVRGVLPQAFERWDGKGLPAGLKGEQLAPAIRVVHLADILEVHHRLGGLDRAVQVARERSRTKFDPELADLFCRLAPDLLASLEVDDAWQTVVDEAPAAGSAMSREQLDQALEAMADFVDVKSPYTSGHSRGVAALSTQAAARLGLAAGEVAELRQAALVHDLGRMGVSNAIWDKPGPLTAAEWERVRLHPYLSERMLSRPPALRRIAELAARHHERLDGSGYPHGLPGTALTPPARLLGAADVYHAMLEPRPHRAELASDKAAVELRKMARAGKLDGEAVEAVLGAAGHRVGRRGSWPNGLTSREVEILVLVARGGTNRELALQLHITEKTLRNHLEHIYSKVEVSNRTGAILFAIEHGLTGHFPHPKPERP
jgi:HD-GYP domain-containing protein (c-di-GMP phosphodiesterase class II)/DNA-binding CsgD family transcriptional regulator